MTIHGKNMKRKVQKGRILGRMEKGEHHLKMESYSSLRYIPWRIVTLLLREKHKIKNTTT